MAKKKAAKKALKKSALPKKKAKSAATKATKKKPVAKKQPKAAAVGPTLKLSVNDDKLVIEALRPKRLSRSKKSYGTILTKIDPKEVEVTPQALKALLQAPERTGVSSATLWANKTLGWGNQKDKASVSLEKVSVETGAKVWLERCTVLNAKGEAPAPAAEAKTEAKSEGKAEGKGKAKASKKKPAKASKKSSKKTDDKKGPTAEASPASEPTAEATPTS